MLDWFTVLPLAEQVFAGLTLGFGTLLTLLMVGSLIGTEVDLDGDIDADVDGAFSLKGILAFLTFLGFGGWIMLRLGSPLWLACLVGLGAGYAMMTTLALLITRLRRLDSDGSRRAENLLLQEGTVYLPIAAGGAEGGRLQVLQGARLVEVEAITRGSALAAGESARVVEVLGPGRVRVERLDAFTDDESQFLS